MNFLDPDRAMKLCGDGLVLLIKGVLSSKVGLFVT